MNDRVEWIDLSKGIGIMLMLLAHVISKDNFICNVIYQFHMPLFYILSGYLYVKKDLKKFLESKIIGLWLPFVVSATIVEVVVIFFHGVDIESIKTFLGIYLMLKRGTLLGATWFFIVLFYGIIFFNLLNRFIAKRIDRNLIIICLFFIGLFIEFPFHISHVLVAQLFFAFGKELKNINLIEKLIHLKLSIFLKTLLIGVLIAPVFIISLFNKTEVSTNTYTYPLLFPVAAIFGSIFVIFVSIQLSCLKNTVIEGLIYIGKKSTGIVIWQFISFKVVILIQILFYGLSFEKIKGFPVLYEYNNVIWVSLYIISAIFISLIIEKWVSSIYKPILKILKKQVTELTLVTK